MPAYDCGVPDCIECQRAFGPDRSKAIANYRARERLYDRLERRRNDPTFFDDGLGEVFTSAEFERSQRQ